MDANPAQIRENHGYRQAAQSQEVRYVRLVASITSLMSR
jgi:hypothetical protein